MTGQLDRLRDMTAAEIDDDLARTFDGAPPPRWETVGASSRVWLHHVASGLEDLWAAVEPEWRRQRVLREHEVRRFGRAALSGTLDLELADAHPRGRAVDSGFEFPDSDGTEAHVGDRVLLLNPVLAGLDLTVSNVDRPESVYFAFPARSVRPPISSGGRQELLTLLTAPRAALLELASTAQPSMSYLARATHLTPGSVTHHIGWLERCGLVQRHRDGRTVRVAVTSRGRRLVALFTD